MTEEVIEYKSGSYVIGAGSGVLETNINQGIKCTWSGTMINSYSQIKYSWKFEWDDLKNDGVSGLTGYVMAKNCSFPTTTTPVRIDVNLTEGDNTIERIVNNYNNVLNIYVAFEYYFTPVVDGAIPLEVRFEKSEDTDAVLVIEGKKMHVNKKYLSMHSEYFRALFSSNFKEGQMDEIPIQDAIFDDMAMLLSMIIPMGSYPSDKTSEKLLELADRFMMPSVTHHVEHFLLNYSKIKNEKLLWMADKYNMSKLLKKTINGFNSSGAIKNIAQSPEYNEMTDKTKLALFNRVIKFI